MQVVAGRVLLRPADMDAAISFYEDVVGLVRFREWGAPPRRGVVLFMGGGYLELTETPAQEPRPEAPQGFRLWLQVPDIASAHGELVGLGVPVAEEPVRKPWGLLEMVVHDPDGVEVVVVEVPGDHPLRRR